MDLTFQVLCNTALYSIGPCFQYQSQPQLGVVFTWLSLFILSGVSSPLISSSILDIYRPGEFIFQYSIFLSFHTVHGVLMARILQWFAIAFSSGPCLSELSTMTCLPWVTPHGIAHSFTQLDITVIQGISLVFYNCSFHYVFSLMDEVKKLVEAP